jgi:hypothetical protein
MVHQTHIWLLQVGMMVLQGVSSVDAADNTYTLGKNPVVSTGTQNTVSCSPCGLWTGMRNGVKQAWVAHLCCGCVVRHECWVWLMGSGRMAAGAG